MGIYEKYKAKRLKKLKTKRVREEGRAVLREAEQEEIGAIEKAQAKGKGKGKGFFSGIGLGKGGLRVGGATIGISPEIRRRGAGGSPMGLTPIVGGMQPSGMLTPFGGRAEPIRKRVRKRKRKRKGK